MKVVIFLKCFFLKKNLSLIPKLSNNDVLSYISKNVTIWRFVNETQNPTFLTDTTFNYP